MSFRNLLRRFFGRALTSSADPIKHVVVLMFENHSFDQMLGCLKSVYPGLDGVDPANLRSNADSNGRQYSQRPSNDTTVDPDPKHELCHILNSLKNDNGGFVLEYEEEYPNTTPDQRQKIMDYFELGTLPALHELAQHFTICDHWYSSVPGPTWVNRFFVHSGTSLGRVEMPNGSPDPRLYLGYDQNTIYDRLNERHIRWRIYHGDVPQSLLLSHQRRPENAIRYRWLNDFFGDAAGAEEKFPSYVFIEPNYFHFPLEAPQNDDHPPHSTTAAQALLARVYQAIRKNEALWNSTLLVVLYDENGGFYDHVPPPAATPPDKNVSEFAFNQYGVRVPALLISPWVGQGVIPTEFDHTSLLKYLIEKWGLDPLTCRVTKANSISEAILKTPRSNLLKGVPGDQGQNLLAAPAAPTAEIPLNDHQKALLRFTEYLEKESDELAAMKMATVATALPTEAHVVKQRVESYLETQKRKAMVQPGSRP